jgi:hypothetical protein
MNRTGLIRLSGLATMVGGVVFALVLLVRPWLAHVAPFGLHGLAEAVTLPMFCLLLVVVSLALVAIAALLRRTRHGGLGVLACVVSLVGVVLVFVGVLLGYAGIFVIFVGALVATGGLGILAIITTSMNTLPWWGGVALVAGGLSFILVFLPVPTSLMGVPWLVVGYAIFRAMARQAEQPLRMR